MWLAVAVAATSTAGADHPEAVGRSARELGDEPDDHGWFDVVRGEPGDDQSSGRVVVGHQHGLSRGVSAVFTDESDSR
jgi:hypothetical protein